MQNGAEVAVVPDEDAQSLTSLRNSPSAFWAIDPAPAVPNSVIGSESDRNLSGSPTNQSAVTLQAPVDAVNCCVCFDFFPPGSGVHCRDCGGAFEERLSHFYCNSCFSDNVVSQATGECKAAFVQHGQAIECIICKSQGYRSVFNMQLLCSHLSREAYTHYIKALSEPFLMETELRFEARICELQGRIDFLECKTYTNHIQEHLMQPRCPRLDCRALLLDFDHCAHLQVNARRTWPDYEFRKPIRPHPSNFSNLFSTFIPFNNARVSRIASKLQLNSMP